MFGASWGKLSLTLFGIGASIRLSIGSAMRATTRSHSKRLGLSPANEQ